MKISAIFLMLLCACLMGVPTALQAAPLSPIEKQIQRYLESQTDAQLSLLEELVNINSPTLNLAGVRQVGEIARGNLMALGFKTSWVLQPAEMHRVGTLIAERKGPPGGKRLLLIGHLDTMLPKGHFEHFERHADLATGSGIISGKGGLAVILYALKALDAVNALENTTIVVVLTGDEEDVGQPTSISRKALVEAAQHSDVALDFEWALDLGTAVTARRGMSHWTLETAGNEWHPATLSEPLVNDGAVFELARILSTIRTKFASEKYLLFNPNIILGGESWDYDRRGEAGTASGKNKVTAKTTFASGDLYFLNEEQQKSAQEKIRLIVGKSLPGTIAVINFQEGVSAMVPSIPGKKLLQDYSQASVDLGYEPVKAQAPGLRGAADISYIANSMAANLAGLGPVGTGARLTRETLDIPSLFIATERAALLLYRLTHPAEQPAF